MYNTCYTQGCIHVYNTLYTCTTYKIPPIYYLIISLTKPIYVDTQNKHTLTLYLPTQALAVELASVVSEAVLVVVVEVVVVVILIPSGMWSEG